LSPADEADAISQYSPVKDYKTRGTKGYVIDAIVNTLGRSRNKPASM
jgi:hypothetical protein